MKNYNQIFKLSEIVEIYVLLNKTHIYNNIKSPADLENIITSSKHILTNFDLLLLSEKYNITFTIYDGNINRMEEFSTIEYPNEDIERKNVNLIEKIIIILIFITMYQI